MGLELAIFRLVAQCHNLYANTCPILLGQDPALFLQVNLPALQVPRFLSGHDARIVLRTDVYCSAEHFSSLSMAKEERSKGCHNSARRRLTVTLSETKTHSTNSNSNSNEQRRFGSMFAFGQYIAFRDALHNKEWGMQRSRKRMKTELFCREGRFCAVESALMLSVNWAAFQGTHSLCGTDTLRWRKVDTYSAGRGAPFIVWVLISVQSELLYWFLVVLMGLTQVPLYSAMQDLLYYRSFVQEQDKLRHWPQDIHMLRLVDLSHRTIYGRKHFHRNGFIP